MHVLWRLISYIALLLPFVDGLLFHFVEGFQAAVDLPLLLPLHDESVGHQFVDAGHLDARGPVVADRRERRPVDGAHGDQPVHAVLLLDVAHRVAPGEPPWRRSPGMGGVAPSRKSAGPFIVSMYWCRTRHMWPHSPPMIHLTPSRLAPAEIFDRESTRPNFRPG